MATFKIGEAKEIAVHVKGQIDGAAQRALLSTAHRLVAHIQNEVIPGLARPPVDRGLYRAAWRAKSLSDTAAEVANKLPYAPIIEYGARAGNIKVGRAMIDALESWVSRKGIASKAEARGVAWAIAMNMKKHGIFNGGKGLRVLATALKKFKSFFKEEHAREAARG